jgi:hypothetical protein
MERRIQDRESRLDPMYASPVAASMRERHVHMYPDSTRCHLCFSALVGVWCAMSTTTYLRRLAGTGVPPFSQNSLKITHFFDTPFSLLPPPPTMPSSRVGRGRCPAHSPPFFPTSHADIRPAVEREIHRPPSPFTTDGRGRRCLPVEAGARTGCGNA